MRMAQPGSARDRSNCVTGWSSSSTSRSAGWTIAGVASLIVGLACMPDLRADTAAPPANPFAGARLHLRANTPARVQAERWRRVRPADAARIDRIASQPQAVWLGDWTRDVQAEAAALVSEAAREGTLPVIVAYNIPRRDCGGHAAGGVSSADAYRRWITALARGIGVHPAVVVLEPDGTAEIDCLDPRQLEERFELLRFAVRTLEANPGTAVYVDAGNALWMAPGVMAARLARAGIAEAQGFALNVSNFVADSITRPYGERISALAGGKHFIIDSGRNGRGAHPDAEWCNPPGRALGRPPSVATGHARVDAYLWIKPPGESDGPCNGGPAAGEWWAEYALGLTRA